MLKWRCKDAGLKSDQKGVNCDRVSLRCMIPDDHLLVRIHESKELDLSFIYEITKKCYCANYGRPSIDPVLFCKMQIICYLYGIRSNRRLCKEIQWNVAYRWFCGLSLEDKVPDHSSLSRIRDRFGVELFQEIFISLVKQWYKFGIIKGETIISDASMDSLTLRKDKSDPQKRELKIYECRYHDFRKGKKVRKISNQIHVSRTYPDLYQELVVIKSYVIKPTTQLIAILVL